MTFRTNQPGSALASLSAFWEQSMQQNRATDLRRIPLWSTTLSISALAWHLGCLPSRKTRAPVPPLLPLSGGDSPHGYHLHNRKCSLIRKKNVRYMMLNRDRDRERAAPLFVVSSRQIIWMVLIPAFFLVSFGFESLPLPVPDLSFESRHPRFFFHMPGKVPHLSTFIIINPRVEWGWKHKQKERGKVERGEEV